MWENLALFIFIGFAWICGVFVIKISMHNTPSKDEDITEDNFIVYAPRMSLLAMVLIVFASGSLASLALFLIPRLTEMFFVLLLVFSFIAIGFAVFCAYGIIYYMSFRTIVNGDKFSHKELFYPEFTLTVKDIKRAEYGKRIGNIMLILYTNTETILEAEDHFVGYDKLISYVERKASVRIMNQI